MESLKTLLERFGQILYRTDELVVLAEGEIEIEIEGKSQQPPIVREMSTEYNQCVRSEV